MDANGVGSWNEFSAAFLSARRGRGASPATLEAYGRDLAAFAAWSKTSVGAEPIPAAVTELDVSDWRRHLAGGGRRPATVNRALASLKAAMAWAVGEGIVASNPAAGVRPVSELRPGPRALDRRELGAILREARRAGSVRDACLITLLAQTGLRIGEALVLTWDDVVLRERSGAVTVRSGKGGRRREVPLTLTARRALAEWRRVIEDRAPLPRWVFPGQAPSRPLTQRAVQAALSRYARRAGLERAITPHTLRHTFCKSLVDAGVSLDRVAALAGHASLNTTARYTTPTMKDLERAVEELEWV